MAQRVIDRIQNSKPPGRFWEWKTGNCSYTLAPEASVLEKVCQMHREQLSEWKSVAAVAGSPSLPHSVQTAKKNPGPNGANEGEEESSSSRKSVNIASVKGKGKTQAPVKNKKQSGTKVNGLPDVPAKAMNAPPIVKHKLMNKVKGKIGNQDSVDVSNAKPSKKTSRVSGNISQPSGSKSVEVPSAVASAAELEGSPGTLPPKLAMLLARGGKPRTQAQSGEIVEEPHPFDVLFGRGNSVSAHSGNTIFRHFCWLHKSDYNAADR